MAQGLGGTLQGVNGSSAVDGLMSPVEDPVLTMAETLGW